MGVFDSMLEIEQRKAFCDRRGRHCASFDKEYIALREYILSDACTEDIQKLKNGEYFIQIPNRFKIRKSNSDRRRICYSYKGKDSYLLKLMSFVLMDFDNLFADSLYSFRRFQDHRTFFNRLKRFDFGRKTFVLKMDVHSYGESVDQDILLEKLDVIFENDPEYRQFLHWFLKRNCFYERGELRRERISIIPGTPIGTFFNNVYLMDMDKVIEANSKLYMRFADDIAVFVNTYEEAESMKAYILEQMDTHKLVCNPDKTEIYAPGEAFSILGIEAAPYRYDIAPSSLNKILYKIKHKQDRLLRDIWRKKRTQEEAFEYALHFVNRYFYGFERETEGMCWTAWAFGVITVTDTLKRIDHSVQDFLRSVKSGKACEARFRTKYDELHAAGYRSLVYSYYHDHDTNA